MIYTSFKNYLITAVIIFLFYVINGCGMVKYGTYQWGIPGFKKAVVINADNSGQCEISEHLIGNYSSLLQLTKKGSILNFYLPDTNLVYWTQLNASSVSSNTRLSASSETPLIVLDARTHQKLGQLPIQDSVIIPLDIDSILILPVSGYPIEVKIPSNLLRGNIKIGIKEGATELGYFQHAKFRIFKNRLVNTADKSIWHLE